MQTNTETKIDSSVVNSLYSWDHPMYVRIYEVIHAKVKNKAVTENLVEAIRRMNMFVLLEKDKLESFGNGMLAVLDRSFLLAQMTGLGTPSEYKKSLEKGYMRCKGTEVKSVKNWYFLTAKGFDLVKPYLFLKEMDEGCQDFPKFELRCTVEKLNELTML